MMRIVGVDPGTTTAVAVLDLDGSLVAHRSAKEFDQSDVTSFIIDHGKPLILATDVSPAPGFVEKLASAFGAELFVPDDDLGQDEKEALLHSDERSFDSHTRDAIAAGRRAVNAYDDIVTKVRHHVKETDLALETVLGPVVKDDRSVRRVIEAQQDQDDDSRSVSTDENGSETDWQQKAAEYRQQVAQKQKEVARLRSYVETLKDDIAELQDQRDRLQDERHAEAMRDDLVQRWKQRAEDYKKQLDDEKNTTANLENRIDRYQMALDFIHDGETVLKIRMDESAVAETEGPIMMVGPHVQAPPPEPVEVVIITAEDDRSYYDEYGVAVLHYQELRGLKLESYYIIDEETVLDAIDTDSETFMDWLETYRDRQ